MWRSNQWQQHLHHEVCLQCWNVHVLNLQVPSRHLQHQAGLWGKQDGNLRAWRILLSLLMSLGIPLCCPNLSFQVMRPIAVTWELLPDLLNGRGVVTSSKWMSKFYGVLFLVRQTRWDRNFNFTDLGAGNWQLSDLPAKKCIKVQLWLPQVNVKQFLFLWLQAKAFSRQDPFRRPFTSLDVSKN
jgi:hypothetical protein